MHDGKFSFPGGKREEREPWPATAARELFEETGLMVNEWTLRKLGRRKKGKCRENGVEWRCSFYLTESWSGVPEVKEPEKHDELVWHPLNEVPRNVVPPVRKILINLRKSYFSKVRQHSPSKVGEIYTAVA